MIMTVAQGQNRPSYGYMASIRISFVFLNPSLLRRRLSRPRTNGKGYAAGREGSTRLRMDIPRGYRPGILKGGFPVFEREISLGLEQVFPFSFAFFARNISKPFLYV